MHERPNILMIMADQFRLTTLDGMGDQIPTPNIKRIMDRGLVFTQSCCACPLCTPSRAALATGKYPSRCGVTVHDAVLPPEQETYYQVLRKAGYRVGMAGKSDLHKAETYCGNGMLPSMYHYGFTDPYETEGKMNSAWFGRSESGGIRPMGPYQRYLVGRDPARLEALNTDYKSYLREKRRFYAAPSILPDEDFLDNFIGRAACDWLEQVEDDLPWHYFVSFAGPHNPWDPPRENYEHFKDAQFPVPVADDLAGKPDWVKQRAAKETGGMTAAQALNMRRCYAASVEVVDQWVGKLLDTLERRGLWENTVVIFCADHGEMLGDHGLLEKTVMYEASVRIPLIISAPWMEGRQDTNALAQLMDLAPTCLELAGVGWNKKDMDARSLLPLLRGETGQENQPHEVQISELLNSLMVYDGRYKWIRNWNDTDELYDLLNDPKELHNVFAEYPKVIQRLRAYTFRH